MKTEKMKLSELRQPEKNARIHPPRQIKEMIRSIQMFGQIRPLVVDENNVILAGNGLYEALKGMGATEADVLRVTGLTENQKKKLMLADNRIYSLGVDNNDMILEILAEMKDDLDVPGFDEDLLRNLLADFEETEQQIMSYGKLDEEEIAQIHQAAERKEAMIQRAEQRLAEQDSVDPVEPEESNAQSESKVASQPNTSSIVASYPPPAEDRRIIKCPHCGGVIEL